MAAHAHKSSGGCYFFRPLDLVRAGHQDSAPRVFTTTVPRGNPIPKTKLELEELRANPPKVWSAQRQNVDEILLVGKLEKPLALLDVMRERNKYPTLAAARVKELTRANGRLIRAQEKLAGLQRQQAKREQEE